MSTVYTENVDDGPIITEVEEDETDEQQTENNQIILANDEFKQWEETTHSNVKIGTTSTARLNNLTETYI